MSEWKHLLWLVVAILCFIVVAGWPFVAAGFGLLSDDKAAVWCKWQILIYFTAVAPIFVRITNRQ